MIEILIKNTDVVEKENICWVFFIILINNVLFIDTKIVARGRQDVSWAVITPNQITCNSSRVDRAGSRLNDTDKIRNISESGTLD